ncbi:hypothetical protein BpHYR1_037219 [Brachionus plicatilis]|uniref:Uncharacterized protein n=1 Tax=Brachionus plicatilis TaxID=10195 RepID=A0A3M7PLF9_BRAPC|nr:hypothetical protein BpHYR1_037219 [Brachionus plicatilis]
MVLCIHLNSKQRRVFTRVQVLYSYPKSYSLDESYLGYYLYSYSFGEYYSSNYLYSYSFGEITRNILKKKTITESFIKNIYQNKERILLFI